MKDHEALLREHRDDLENSRVRVLAALRVAHDHPDEYAAAQLAVREERQRRREGK